MNLFEKKLQKGTNGMLFLKKNQEIPDFREKIKKHVF